MKKQRVIGGKSKLNLRKRIKDEKVVLWIGLLLVMVWTFPRLLFLKLTSSASPMWPLPFMGSIRGPSF
jgi:hypothetical protein